MFSPSIYLSLCFAFATLLLLPAYLSASVLSVTKLADTNDSVCDADCSLREAIQAAAIGDTIIFARDLRGGIIFLTTTLLINKRIIIDGPNKRRITLSGDNTFRIIEARAVVSIDGLIIQNGNAIDKDGGGILGSGSTLNLTDVTLANNRAEHGGAIYMLGGLLILTESSVVGNAAAADNAAGGLDLFQTELRMINCTISGNQSTSLFGGTGGIRLTNPPASFIRHSTIAFNSALGNDFRTAGGLVVLNGMPGPETNTIIARNSGLNPDLYGRVGGSNILVGVTDERSGIVNGVNGNIVGSLKNPIDPLIAPLADNGAGMPTHALLAGSLAVNAGNNSYSINRHGQPLTTDQRGYSRVVNSVVDMGSYEFGSQPEPTTSTVTGLITSPEGRGVSGVRVTLRGPGQEPRYATTNPFGYYRFVNVPPNITYTFECFGKRNRFSSQEILVEEDTEFVFVVGLP